MTIANSISQESIKQIDMLLTCIASNAATIKTLTYEILESGADLQNVGALADALECVASSIGYMADEGLGNAEFAEFRGIDGIGEERHQEGRAAL